VRALRKAAGAGASTETDTHRAAASPGPAPSGWRGPPLPWGAAVANRVGDDWNGAIALNNLGDLALNSGDWERVVELCGQSSEIRRGIGDRWGAALARTKVAQAEIQLGRLEHASRSVGAALEDSLAVGADMVFAAGLDTAAMLTSALGRASETARLLGAAERLREELGSVRESFEQGQHESATASARATLGAEAFASEFEEGRTMSLEEAAEFALTAIEV
jgi:hypothetical protein